MTLHCFIKLTKQVTYILVTGTLCTHAHTNIHTRNRTHIYTHTCTHTCTYTHVNICI